MAVDILSYRRTFPAIFGLVHLPVCAGWPAPCRVFRSSDHFERSKEAFMRPTRFVLRSPYPPYPSGDHLTSVAGLPRRRLATVAGFTPCSFSCSSSGRVLETQPSHLFPRWAYGPRMSPTTGATGSVANAYWPSSVVRCRDFHNINRILEIFFQPLPTA